MCIRDREKRIDEQLENSLKDGDAGLQVLTENIDIVLKKGEII